MMEGREKLIQSFEELFAIEKKAHDYYEKILQQNISDHEEEVVLAIHNDEERHMKIVKEIIQIIESES